MKTNLQKVKDKLSKGWILCQQAWYGIPRWYFIKDNKISKYPRINEEIFCDELVGHVPYRMYGYKKGVEYQEVNNEKTKHRISRLGS